MITTSQASTGSSSWLNSLIVDSLDRECLSSKKKKFFFELHTTVVCSNFHTFVIGIDTESALLSS